MSVLAELRGLLPNGHTRDEESADGPVCVVLLADEPYLEFVMRRLSGDLEVTRPDPQMPIASLIALEPDVVVGAADDPRLVELGSATGARTVAVVPRVRRVDLRPRPWQQELAKPFVEADVARALGLPTRRAEVPERGPLQGLLRSLPALRLATVALAAVLELLTMSGGDGRAALLAVAFLWATARAFLGGHTLGALLVDLGVALLLLAGTGGLSSSYGLVAVLAAVQVGLVAGWLRGLAGGTALSVVALVAAFLESRSSIGLTDVVLAALLYPVAGFTAGLGAGLARERSLGDERVLSEANRMLRELQHFSRSVPGGLELRSVAQAVVEELREETTAEATVLLVDSAGHLAAVAASGLGGVPRVLVGPDDPTFERIRRGRLHRLDTTVLDDDDVGLLRVHDTWIAEPLRWSGGVIGVLLAAPGSEDEAVLRDRMRGLAGEASVAIENALLYQDLRSVTVDEERRRLAAEMHDGLAQVLAHLRFELDMMAAGATPPEEVAREAERLARVADRALGEARATITGLRASVATAGLAATLRDYVRDLRGLAGPGIELDVQTGERLLPEVEREVFRIAQEAISNALRHSHADRVAIGLRRIGGDVVLTIDDDGVGFEPHEPTSNGRAARGRGLGLGDLRERAARIGCELDVVSRVGGGTHVEVRCPERLQIRQVPEEEHA